MNPTRTGFRRSSGRVRVEFVLKVGTIDL